MKIKQIIDKKGETYESKLISNVNESKESDDLGGAKKNKEIDLNIIGDDLTCTNIDLLKNAHEKNIYNCRNWRKS